MSQLAVCLVEFLAFLGVPYLRALKKFIQSAIIQLQIAEGELIAQLALTQSASTAINKAVGVATLVANEVQNILGGLPLGTFQECAAASVMVGTLRSSFDSVLDFYEETLNGANRVRAFTDVQTLARSQIDDQIAYLQNLNDQIDVIIVNLLIQQANNV